MDKPPPLRFEEDNPLLKLNPHRSRQHILLALAVMHFVAGLQVHPPYLFADLIPHLSYMWEVLFFTSSVLLLVCISRRPGPFFRVATYIVVILCSSTRGFAIWLVADIPVPVDWLPPPAAMGWFIALALEMTALPYLLNNITPPLKSGIEMR